MSRFRILNKYFLGNLWVRHGTKTNKQLPIYILRQNCWTTTEEFQREIYEQSSCQNFRLLKIFLEIGIYWEYKAIFIFCRVIAKKVKCA